MITFVPDLTPWNPRNCHTCGKEFKSSDGCMFGIHCSQACCNYDNTFGGNEIITRELERVRKENIMNNIAYVCVAASLEPFRRIFKKERTTTWEYILSGFKPNRIQENDLFELSNVLATLLDTAVQKLLDEGCHIRCIKPGQRELSNYSEADALLFRIVGTK